MESKWIERMVLAGLFGAFMWTAPPLSFFLTSADHASNIGLGALIAKGGMFPFVDHFHFYGPLAALGSALAMTIHDSLVSEVVLCAAGYALSTWLLYRFTARHAGVPAGVVVVLIAFRFSARFYKYYFWLMPAIALELVDRLATAKGARRSRTLLALGLVAATGSLFRFDLGLALTVYGLVALAARSLFGSPGNARSLSDLGVFGLGLGIPWSAWLLTLALRGGVGSIADYFAATWDGTLGYVAKNSGMRESPWRFDAADPLSITSSTSLLLVAVPLVYLAALVWGGAALRRREAAPAREWALAAAGLLGLGLFPQALHTPDAHHLLHAAAPLFPCLAILLTSGWKPASGPKPRLGATRLAVTLLASVIAVGGYGIRQVGARDLTPFARDVAEKFRLLERGIDAPEAGFWGRAMRQVRDLTNEDDRILMLYNEAYFYYFTGRPMGGIFHNYTGVFAGSPAWRGRNLDALRRDPPRLVVARGDMLAEPPDTNFLYRTYPEYFTFVTRRYRKLLYQEQQLLILGRD